MQDRFHFSNGIANPDDLRLRGVRDEAELAASLKEYVERKTGDA